MRRKLRHEKVERLRYANPSVFTTIAAKLTRFAEDYSERVRSARPVLPDELSDRAQDHWEPLLAIAACAGPAWVTRATAAALKLSGDTAASTGNELLADIQGILAKLKTGRIRSADLIEALCADAEAAWATFNNGRQLTPRQLSKLLSVYGIHPKTVRQGKDTPKGYDKAQFEDAFARYLAAPPDLPQQGNDSPEAMTGKAGGVSDDLVGDWGDAEDALDCGGVADKRWTGPKAFTDDDF
jgi:putative DNA primase/helicase